MQVWNLVNRCHVRSEKPSHLPVSQSRSGSPPGGGLVVVSQLAVAVSILVLEIIIFILTAITNCIYGVDARSESEIR
jgi:hypothetical protein